MQRWEIPAGFHRALTCAAWMRGYWTYLILALGSYWQDVSASNAAQQSSSHMGRISVGQEVQQMLTDAAACCFQ